MKFEFDPEKSHANKLKQGMDFTEAQALWDDPDLLEIPARTTDEARFLVIAKIGGKHWSAIITRVPRQSIIKVWVAERLRK